MLVIAEKQLNGFIEKLKGEFEFFSASGGDSLPFKKYFFPPIQEIFSLGKKNKINVAKAPAKEFILFGLSLPALEALTYLDEIMKKPNEDFFYFQKRKKALVIGLIHQEMDVAPGGDIVFQSVHIVGGQQDGKIYRVFLNSRRANNLVLKNKDFFEEINEKEIKIEVAKDGPSPIGEGPSFADFAEWSKSMRELLLDSELLKDAVEWSRENHPIWEELRSQCLGCGICTYVCPLCHCFSIEDKVGIDDKCSRCRKWDACTLPGFAKISGGYSFRPTIKERYYNWFYHKFVRAYLEYGKPQCVGCGNCKKYCPAKIDIQEILKKILEDYKKQQ
ncbi:MAG: 4Fe-4S dicluster domain-containing protein [Candidatus Terrybacteria bacterium]|nr:4Fe-4S dicluster domain-containing protein [Candidatus Terrybacteria bacterium]